MSNSVERKRVTLPDNFNFLFNLRKRSQKWREKEFEENNGVQLTEDLVNRVHKSKNLFKMPCSKNLKESEARKQKKANLNLEALIYRKFNNKQSVNKILLKTAKLQKNIDEKLNRSEVDDETRGEAIRTCMLKRMKVFHMANAANYEK